MQVSVTYIRYLFWVLNKIEFVVTRIFFFLGFWGGFAAIHSERLIKRNMEASLGSFISIPLFNQSVESSWTE